MKNLMRNLMALQTLEFDGSETETSKIEITKLRGEIPAQILGHYDRLRARGKKGVAEVRNQVCSGCHVRVPLGSVLALQHEQDVQLCENCGRYLCLPETPNVPTLTPPAKAARGITPRRVRKQKPVAPAA